MRLSVLHAAQADLRRAINERKHGGDGDGRVNSWGTILRDKSEEVERSAEHKKETRQHSKTKRHNVPCTPHAWK